MSSSIPIPPRHASSSNSRTPTAAMPDARGLGMSLPNSSTALFGNPSSHPIPSPLALPLAQDDLSITPSVELISPAARQWGNSTRSSSAFPTPRHSFGLPSWDFSELVTAADEVRSGMERGATIAKRPPRAGVSGTYFFCTEDEEKKLGVFKPMDEEAQSIDMSPQSSFSSNFAAPCDFSLGPAAHLSSSPPAFSPPRFSSFVHRTGSVSSDSENDSFPLRATNHLPDFHKGEGAYREVAAYLLDTERFARVPQTALLQWLKPYEPSDSIDLSPDCLSPAAGYSDPYNGGLSSDEDVVGPQSDSDSFGSFSALRRDEVNLQTKKGAFQVYVPNLGDADDFGPGVFDKDQVHRIACFDIRILNHDRHGGNILVAKSKSPDRRYDLVPIDHGYILPDNVQSMPWPIWMDWPMIREPLSEPVKNYIRYLDADNDSRRLNVELDGVFRARALQGLKIATTLLQKGVAAGLTLYDIGLLMYSRGEEPGERTELAKIVCEAKDASLARERHIAEEMLQCDGDDMPAEPHHRRHQSMPVVDTHDSLVDEYIVKFASRKIQEVVTRIAAAKALAQGRSDDWRSSKPGFLSRARSIPDFVVGIGEKPLHAILNFRSPNEIGQNPAPTPASSPMAVSPAKARGSALEAQLPVAAPIQVPINDRNVVRIALPEPRRLVNNDQNRNIGLDSTGSASDSPRLHSNALPPAGPSFKDPARKSSPVSPMELFKWNSATQP